MPDRCPIAQIFCRHAEKPLAEHFRPGTGFLDPGEVHSSVKSLDVYLFPDQTIQVGRDIDWNNITIIHPYISRQHFGIYSIEYEDGARPLVYVKDYNSLSGTYVYNHSTGPTRVPSSGHLLSHGEIIRLLPYWEFHVYLLSAGSLDSTMSHVRLSETNLFCDRFLITGTILGSGAFASVHLAVDQKTGQQVACKIHRFDQLQQLRNSQGTIRRVIDETNILSRLTHPNLLKFEAAFRSSDCLYTFTELATGGDLFSMRLRYPSGLPEMDIKIIIRQVVEAVSYLHDHNVAHRDLKPENVFFVTGPTLRSRVIVGDLGFAKVAKSGRMATQVGTQRFIAPEVYRGQSYSTKVDIWSIGMISLFLVALDWDSYGCFETFDQNTVDKTLVDIFDDLSTQHKALSDNFEGFIQACLIVDPSKRMTASVAKGHDWFRSSASQLNAQMEEYTREWEPARIVHNSVEDLDLLGSKMAHNSLYSVGLNKITTQGDEKIVGDSQYSSYFSEGNLKWHRREKNPLATRPWSFTLTEPDGTSTLYVGVLSPNDQVRKTTN